MFNPTINLFKKFTLSLLVLLFSATLFSCGGGGGGDDPEPEAKSLTGTAATGVPIDGNVLVTDSSIPPKTVMAVIDASGNYTADVTGFTPPLIISAIPSATNPNQTTEYSFVSPATFNSDTNIKVNISQVTSLALFNANGMQDLDDLEMNWGNLTTPISQQNIDDALAIINANFASLYTGAGLDSNFDPFQDVFNADGTGFDGILDGLMVVLDPDTNSFTVTITGMPGFSFDPNIDTGGGGGGTGSGSFGSLNLSDTGTGDLPFTTFTPDEITDFTAGGITEIIWKVTISDVAYSAIVTLDNSQVVTGAGFTVAAPNTSGNGTISVGWVTLLDLANITVTANSVSFSNVSMFGSGDPFADIPTLTDLTLNGTLSRSTQ